MFQTQHSRVLQDLQGGSNLLLQGRWRYHDESSKKKEKDTAEARLKNLLERQQSKTLAKLKLQKKRASEQLKRLDKQISEREDSADELLEKLIESWQNRIARQTPRSKNKKNNASK